MLEYPGFWYEYLIVLVCGYCVIVSVQMVLQSYYRANLTYAKSDLFSEASIFFSKVDILQGVKGLIFIFQTALTFRKLHFYDRLIIRVNKG